MTTRRLSFLVGVLAAVATVPATASADIGPAPQTTTDVVEAPLPAPVPFSGLSVDSTRLRLVGRYVTVRVRCPVSADGGCFGRTRLVARDRRRLHMSSSLELGAARFAIPAGRQVTLKVHVGRTARQRLAHLDRVQGLVTTAADNGAGQTARSTSTVTVLHA